MVRGCNLHDLGCLPRALSPMAIFRCYLYAMGGCGGYACGIGYTVILLQSGGTHMRVHGQEGIGIGSIVSLSHVALVTSAPLLSGVVWLVSFVCLWSCLFSFVLLFVFCFWGAVDDFFLTSSSRDMTATVLSNVALEKKKQQMAQVSH